MTSLTDQAWQRSLELLQRASSERGFVASPTFAHYSQVWARDAAISAVGALASGKPELIDTAVRTMETLASATSPLGHVPAVVHVDSDSWDWGDGGVVDATAWYVILTGAAYAATGDPELARDQWPVVSKAMSWLRHQDVTGSGLISAAPSTDWMDSSLVRSGRTLNLNALYHWAALASTRIAAAIGEEPPIDAQDLAWRINTLFWPTTETGPESLMIGLAGKPAQFPHSATVRAHAAAAVNRDHYVSHVIHAHYDEHCDVIAHSVLLCTEVADETKAGTILDYLERRGVSDPFPSRVLAEPVDTSKPGSMYVPEVETYLDARWRNSPHHYHNAGIWPFVGGLHTAAIALRGGREQAARGLERLAAANELGEWGFHEWLHGESGEPMGARDQTWNAGMYVLATEAVRDPEKVRRLFS